MEITKVRYKGQLATYVTDIRSPESLRRVKALGRGGATKRGYLLLTTEESVIRELMRIDAEERVWVRKKLKEERQSAWSKYLDETKDKREFADSIKRAIIEKKQLSCPNGSSALMNHQKAGVLIAERFNHYAFFFDTGTGKTLTALQIIRNKTLYEDACFLIICPKAIIRTAWLDDCQHFFPGMKLMPLGNGYSPDDYQQLHFTWAKANGTNISVPAHFFIDGTVKERTAFAREYLSEEANCFIVNPELFKRDPDKFLNIKTLGGYRKINGIVVDESSQLKKRGNEITCVLREIRPRMDYLYLLSGKPAPNTIEEYLPQVELVDPEMVRLSKAAGENMDLTEQINMVSVTVSKKDCFDLPDTTEVVREVELSKDVKAKYYSMKHQMRMELDALPEEERQRKSIVYVNHVLACLSKLRQITGGFIIDEKKESFLHDAKTDEVLNILDELGDEQVLIWCSYRYEIKHLHAVLQQHGYSVATAFGETKNLDDNIYSFKSGKTQVLIAHPRTLQYGVTLVNCCYAIYYSTSYSYEEYYQSHDRIYRKGQSRPCTYIFLQCKGTIDEVMFDTIMKKQTRTEVIEETIKHIYSDSRM